MTNTFAPSQAEPSNLKDGGTLLARMEAEVHALRPEALATQRSIAQWKARDAADPLTAEMVSLPSLPALPPSLSVDAALFVAVAAALLLAARAARRWTLRIQPQVVPPALADPAPPAPVDLPNPISPPSEQDASPRGFDPEAAASEVVRVRKSLAYKREARLAPPAEAGGAVAVEAVAISADWTEDEGVDLELDFAIEVLAVEQAPQPVEPELPQSVAPEPPPPPEPFELPLPAMSSVPTHCEQHDYAVTLALAEESAALSLWPEARELAREVWQAGAPAQRAQALTLLRQIDAR